MLAPAAGGGESGDRRWGAINSLIHATQIKQRCGITSKCNLIKHLLKALKSDKDVHRFSPHTVPYDNGSLATSANKPMIWLG